jgi:hypothetical protein
MKTLKLLDPRLSWALVIGAAYLAARALGVELPGGDALGLGSGLALLGAFGHCDTLDGPVVQLARKALETGNVNLVLPWVRSADEDEIRRAFEHAQAVQSSARRRASSPHPLLRDSGAHSSRERGGTATARRPGSTSGRRCRRRTRRSRTARSSRS